MSSKRFPGVYPPNWSPGMAVPGTRRLSYWDELLGGKLDKQYKPNTIYAVDKDGKQIMMSFNELGIKDAPKDNKEYARKNGRWDPVDTYSFALKNVIVSRVSWQRFNDASDIYIYEYRIPDERITDKLIPNVIFAEEESVSGLFSPVTSTSNGYVSIYAKKVPQSDFVIPVILFE